MRAALLQLNSSDDPGENLATVRQMLAEAVAEGAAWVLTPEVTNCVSSSRSHQASVFRHETADETLHGLRASAAEHGVWLLVGSLGLLAEGPGEAPFVNRSFLIGPDGTIRARRRPLPASCARPMRRTVSDRSRSPAR